ncbi:MAG: Peroxidase [bacterium]|nr:Peroxidase [bacterium]
MSGAYALTIVAPIVADRKKDLDGALADIAADLEHNRLVPFAALTTTHFARFVIVPGRNGAADRLVFESNHDGEPDEYCDHLARVAGAGLDAVFGCCVGWPAGGVADVDGYGAFMRDRRLPAAAFHMGYRGHTKASVLNDLAVWSAVEKWIDDNEPDRAHWKARPALELRARIAAAVAAIRPRLSLQPAAPDHRVLVRWTVGILLALTVGPIYLVLAALLRPRELAYARAWRPEAPLPVAELDALRANEDRRGVVQNQITHVALIQNDRLHRLTLRLGLWAVNQVSRFIMNEGQLGGILTIHFARWVVLDDGRLLFLSNYDGSWESYLGEFVDRAHIGLTGVWSNTEKFPPSRWIVADGATDEESFKWWTRQQQLPTQVWYSSYPKWSIDNILNAIAVRQGLYAHFGEKECRAWLSRL